MKKTRSWWCAFGLHTWGKWKLEPVIARRFGTEYEKTIQMRTCEICGINEVRQL